MCASNPFFMQVCFQIGKLFSLQDQISSSQVYNRMKDIYGDKETTARNTRYAIRTLVSWGMIQDVSGKKVYTVGEQTPRFMIKRLLHYSLKEPFIFA